jgi:hypothetical protein
MAPSPDDGVVGGAVPLTHRPSDINSYVKTIARLRSLAGIQMVCPGHDDCFDGTGLASYAMPTSPAAGKPPYAQRQERDSRRSATVGSDEDGRYNYTDGNAELYGSLRIEGTTSASMRSQSCSAISGARPSSISGAAPAAAPGS